MNWNVTPNSKLLYFCYTNNVVIYDPLSKNLTVWFLYKDVTDPKKFKTLLKHIQDDNTKSSFLRSVLDCPAHFSKDELIRSGQDFYSTYLANLITSE
jgi:hypothetical protein